MEGRHDCPPIDRGTMVRDILEQGSDFLMKQQQLCGHLHVSYTEMVVGGGVVVFVGGSVRWSVVQCRTEKYGASERAA